ncbi:putative aldouronate transport system permease protein [Paenibacillus sp. UNCCL117]|uniref:ABC transporter permease n=1 Tax=unclassified Paenibacillus TaxID=185978 RepID=UPI00087FAB20|nr:MULTISPECIES: ABC transporter permease subunit [unclassified Paenibacillus]SDD58893.1 carbohydrate ABC transporter membrane protein 1, CUT1 family [Paenibacillus sp. cl123]SFW50922.1 putative aldouronate transport system permease protein [Paenibacillus sp. UNCCL117]
MNATNTARRGRGFKHMRRFWALWVMVLPGAVYLLLNNYVPMLGTLIAFKDINYAKGIWRSDWVGLKNFEYLFGTSDAFVITRNTILYNFAFIVITLACSVGLAILLNEVKRSLAKKFYQSALLLPYFLSAVIVAYLTFSMLSAEYGFINKYILAWFHIDPILWYHEPKYWPYILIIVNTWKSVGYFCVVYIAAIVGIDYEYYEAAVMDGAGKWQQIIHITLPLVTPVIITMVLLQIGRIFYSDFGLFYQVPLDSGTLLPVTNVIDTYVYRGLLQLGDLGMSSAAGLYQSIVGFVLVMCSNLIVRRVNRDQALF